MALMPAIFKHGEKLIPGSILSIRDGKAMVFLEGSTRARVIELTEIFEAGDYLKNEG